MALGILEDFSYQSRKTLLRRGDSIFLFTDGITEAVNEKEELFSEERTEKALSELKDKTVEETVAGVMEEIRAFSKGVEQFDDITIMMLRFYGG
jgi:sigma-B regulation protein RsbU (phosphoserine phosphatase)